MAGCWCNLNLQPIYYPNWVGLFMLTAAGGKVVQNMLYMTVSNMHEYNYVIHCGNIHKAKKYMQFQHRGPRLNIILTKVMFHL